MNNSNLSIALIYNHSEQLTKGEADDVIAEEGVLITNEAINKALSTLGYRTASFALNRKTLWQLPANLTSFKADLVFNLCESFEGESQLEKNIPSLLELLLLPYTGSDAFTLGVCLDKFKTKKLLSAFGLATPGGFLMEPHRLADSPELSYPLIVKPNFEDGSLGISNESLVFDRPQLQRRIKYIHQKYRQAALIEEYIEGREFNVAILGNNSSGKKPRVLPLSEIDFSTLPSDLPRICGYQAKWLEDSSEFTGTKPVCPALVGHKVSKDIGKTALKAYQLLGCRDYARVDIRLRSDGTPFILEVNPNPDLSPKAGLARSAEAGGISYLKLIETMVYQAWQRTKGMSRR